MTRQIFAVIGFLVLTAQASWATQYDVMVSGVLNNGGAPATLFGDPNPNVTMRFTFKIDSANAVLIPANTAYNSSGYRFATDAYRISKANLAYFSVTIGNSTFSNLDLKSRTLPLLGDYDVLITGSLDAPIGIQMNFVNAALDELYIGDISCLTGVCSIATIGSAYSYADSGSGTFSLVAPSSQLSGVSSQTIKVNALMTLLSNTSISNRGLSKVLNFDLQTTKKLIEDGEAATARKSLNVFITHVRAAQNGGNLTATQADALVAKATELQLSL